MEQWKTNVKELLENFNGALNALIPWLQKSKIQITPESSYDDFDSIVSVLFENIVVNSISYSKEYQGNTKQIARYDLIYEHYKELDFICVENSQTSDEIIIFVSFVPTDLAMMNVCKVMKSDLKVVSRFQMAFNNHNFYINQDLLLENITVEL